MSSRDLPPYDESSGTYRRSLIPPRAIGSTSVGAVTYPSLSEYPPHLQAVLRRRGSKPVRIFMDGIFDLTHFGHFRALEQAKCAFPHVHLIVGVNSDEDTVKFKGLTVMNERERAEGIMHCKWVDEVIIGSPWVVSPEYLAERDIDLVAHDALPYADASGLVEGGDLYAPFRARGQFYATLRTDGVSTTDLILRIVSRYDLYVTRNLSRGVKASEMNVSVLKELQLHAAAQLHAIGEAVQHPSETISKTASGFLRLFELPYRWGAQLLGGGHAHAGGLEDAEGGAAAGGAAGAGPAAVAAGGAGAGAGGSNPQPPGAGAEHGEGVRPSPSGSPAGGKRARRASATSGTPTRK